MTIHALYHPNVIAHQRQLVLLTDIQEFKSIARDNPAMMTGTYSASSMEEIRKELEHQFEQHDAEMKSIREGY